MPQQRIKDLETELLAAQATIATLSATNLELTRGLADAAARNKKIQRGARRDESAFKAQLSVAQSKKW